MNYPQLKFHTDFDTFSNINEQELTTIFAETGADRELDFNREYEEERIWNSIMYKVELPPIDMAEIRVGDKVCYQPEHYRKENKWENGIVKEIPEHVEDAVRVVYNCAGDWKNYKNYPSALTSIFDLSKGWKH